MKNNFQSLTNFAQEIERIEQTKNDYLVSTKEIIMTDDNYLEFEGHKGEDRLAVNEYAHGQIADKCGIPRKYYDKMIERPALRSLNVNAWLHQKEERNLVRTLDNKVRAVLSDRFKPIDNFGILMTSIFPVLQPIKNELEIKALSVSETKMYIQFIIKSLTAEIKVGDVVQYGLTISNSEVGAGSLNVEDWIWRKVCSNGMVRQSLFKKYHVGKRIEEDENYHIWKSDTLKNELAGYQLRLRDVLNNALTKGSFNEQVRKLQGATTDKVTNIVDTVQNVTKRFMLSENDGKFIIQNMTENKEASRYGIANGITALAHDIENPDRQYQMEKLGSQIIDLSPSDWRIVNAA